MAQASTYYLNLVSRPADGVESYFLTSENIGGVAYGRKRIEEPSHEGITVATSETLLYPVMQLNVTRAPHGLLGPWYIPRDEMDQWLKLFPEMSLLEIVRYVARNVTPTVLDELRQAEIEKWKAPYKAGLIEDSLRNVLEVDTQRQIGFAIDPDLDRQSILHRVHTLSLSSRADNISVSTDLQGEIVRVVRSSIQFMIALGEKEVFTDRTREVWSAAARHLAWTNRKIPLKRLRAIATRCAVIVDHAAAAGLSFEATQALCKVYSSQEDEAREMNRSHILSALSMRLDPADPPLSNLYKVDSDEAVTWLEDNIRKMNPNKRYAMPILDCRNAGIPDEWLYVWADKPDYGLGTALPLDSLRV